jgi:hypothetical protein
MGGHVARIEEIRNAYNILVGKSKRKRQLGRPRRRWEDNISKNLREIGWEGVNWVRLARDRDKWRVLVNTIINIRFP